jgi:hypothetical protein
MAGSGTKKTAEVAFIPEATAEDDLFDRLVGGGEQIFCGREATCSEIFHGGISSDALE